jgi:hypothetical protein
MEKTASQKYMNIFLNCKFPAMSGGTEDVIESFPKILYIDGNTFC